MKNRDANIVQIQRVSRNFRRLLAFFVGFIPTVVFAYWMLFNVLPAGFKSELPVAIDGVLPFEILCLAFVASIVPMSAALYAVLTLKRLFGLYEKAIIFSDESVSCFRHLGYAAVLWVAANFVFTASISVILSHGNPEGERFIVAQFGSSDIGTLIVGAVVILISWVMREASALQDEQAHTV